MTEQIDEKILKRYSVLQRVGKGAYGIVWKAQDKQTQQVVALKKVFDAFNNTTDAQRTYREVMFLKQLKDHKNIISLIETYPAVNDKDLYMVFDYMETDLHIAVRAKILHDVHRKFIVYQILKALKFMHSANLIHRDLKPANVLLDSDCLVKLADYGLARMIGFDDDEEDSMLTEYVATRWFRAPEILVGSRNYSKGVDMWSLGCIMGEMILGKALFPGSSTMDQLQKITQLLGSPTSQDIQSLQNTTVTQELFKNINKVPKSQFHEIFRGCCNEEIDLLKRLLVYNSSNRITVEDALKHPYIVEFANPQEEITFTGTIELQLADNKQFKVSEYRDLLYGKTQQVDHQIKSDEVKKRINQLITKQKSQQQSFASYLQYQSKKNIFCKDDAKIKKQVIVDDLNPKFESISKVNTKYQSNPKANESNPKANESIVKHQSIPKECITKVRESTPKTNESLPKKQQLQRQSQTNNLKPKSPCDSQEFLKVCQSHTNFLKKFLSQQTLPKQSNKSLVQESYLSKHAKPSSQQQQQNNQSREKSTRNSAARSSANFKSINQSKLEARPQVHTQYIRQPSANSKVSQTFWRSPLNHTSKNRVLSNLTNTSITNIKETHSPVQKTYNNLTKLLQKM